MNASVSMRWVQTLVCVAAGLAALLAGMGLAPEPDPIPRRWQLELTPGPLRVMTVELDGQSRQFLYFTYKVVNTTGQDQLFAPSIEMSTDTSLARRSGRDVPAEATRAIMDRLENPLLKDQISIVGPLLQGEANAEDGIAVWPMPSEHISNLTLYVAGLSGETRAVDFTNPQTGEKDRVLLRKTMVLRYDMPGEIVDQGSEPFPPAESPRWVMR